MYQRRFTGGALSLLTRHGGSSDRGNTKLHRRQEKSRAHLSDQLAVLVVKRIRNTVIGHDPIVQELTGSVNREGATIGHTKTLRHLLLIQ